MDLKQSSTISTMAHSYSPAPIFPEFKPLGLEDQEFLRRRLWEYQPETSELTFTNLFIWTGYYNFIWSLERDWLLIIGNSIDGRRWALPPIGPPSRAEICGKLLRWLRGKNEKAVPSIERADNRLVAELSQAPGFLIEPLRDHFDYVYRSEDLIQLQGAKYQAKRNHMHQFKRSYAYSYEPMQERHLVSCLELAGSWCALKRCVEDLSLKGEWDAVKVGLRYFHDLDLQGGVILIDNRVEAFTLGELLNRETAVVHIEKGNPLIQGIYAVINQEFCLHSWSQVPFMNREQDLGVAGLRIAKMTYHPHHLVEKFRIQLT